MKKITNLFNSRAYLIFLASIIILILLLLGLSFPEGIYGIKPLKTIMVITKQQQMMLQSQQEEGNNSLLKIFIIVLLIVTILYFVLHPSKILSYIIALFILIFIFLIVPSLLRILDYSNTKSETINKSEIEKQQKVELEESYPETEVIEEQIQNNNNKSYIFYTILVGILGLFFSFIVTIFIFNLIKRIIKEIKDGNFAFFILKDKKKDTLIKEVNHAINTAISLIDTGDDDKNAIINCYIALIYAVKKYAKKTKDPSLTCREFEPVLASIGLDINDIDFITGEFEKARYSSLKIDEATRQNVVKSLQNCIKKLKR